MMRAVILSVLFTAIGCATPKTVRQQDLLSWQRAAVSELEVHPLFSTLPKKVDRMSDGGELWTYSNCVAAKGRTTCVDIGSGVTSCGGGEQGQVCCHNQFLVRGQSVEWYRAVGSCYTDCSVRPVSRAQMCKG